MSFDRLEPEIWDNVFSFLSAPIPRPLSGLTKEEAVTEEKDPSTARLPHAGALGVTARADLLRSDLVNVMRTSIVGSPSSHLDALTPQPFYRLASVHLYRYIVTDQIISLTSHVNSPPAHPQIESKSELLGRTRSLYLEYQKLGDEPTYADLMADKCLWRLLTDPLDFIWVITQSIIKVDHLQSQLFGLIRRSNPLFPNLHTLALGAIFGGQEKAWDRTYMVGSEPPADVPQNMAYATRVITAQMQSMGVSIGPVSKRIEACSRMLEIIFGQSPIHDYCQRANKGPLSLPRLVKWAGKVPSSPSPRHIIHFNSQTQSLPVAIGYPTRWVLEQHERITVLPELVNQVNHLLKASKRERIQQGMPEKDFDLEIYSSSNRYAPPQRSGRHLPSSAVTMLDAKQEREGIADLGRSMLASNAHRRSAPSSDVISWRALIDVAPCRACGWAYEGEEG